MPNQVLNLALKQVQGLSNSESNVFRVSEMLNRVQHAVFMDFMTQKFQILLAGPLFCNDNFALLILHWFFEFLGM